MTKFSLPLSFFPVYAKILRYLHILTLKQSFKTIFYKQYVASIFSVFSYRDQAPTFKDYLASKNPKRDFSLEKQYKL